MDLNQVDKIAIETLLQGFISEMNAWEVYCNALENEDLDVKQETKLQRAKLADIFNRYCTQKERKYGRIDNISYGAAGSYGYNKSEEKITEIKLIKPGRIEVKTERQKPMEELYLYVVFKKKDGWRIDSKKRFSSWKKKWVISSL